jgi:hypothetical protein
MGWWYELPKGIRFLASFILTVLATWFVLTATVMVARAVVP